MTRTQETLSHTSGPWKAIAQGGSSTVVCQTKPARNDTRIPPYAYDESRGHCIAYPFNLDTGGVRQDFVCFSHDDARLIAAAPELLAGAKAILAARDGHASIAAINQLRDAIAKAEGRS